MAASIPEPDSASAGREGPGAPDPILSSGSGPTLVLTLNRPDRLNAVSPGLYAALETHLASASESAEVRVVVVTGAGRAFSVGADLKEYGGGRPPEAARERYVELAQSVNRQVQELSKPVIAAVQGHAIGGGLELALSCDLIVVAEGAKLRFPELHLGTFVGGGVGYTLPSRVGDARARELLYLGDFFSGADAAKWGLANRSAPADEVLPLSLEWADRVAAAAPIPVRRLKRLLAGTSGGTERRGAILAEEREALLECMGSEDWEEGVRAFAEKREPRFRGR